MKYILVTGAGGGMGLATTKLLCEQGYTVFALDKNPPLDIKNAVPLTADITSEESIIEAYEKTLETTDNLFGIIHFAGIYMLDSLVEIPSDEYDRIFDVNVRGAYLINKTFMPLLKSGSRIIITTSELATLDPLPFTGIYAITKAALDKYAFSLCMELQLHGIVVSVIRAGAVGTPMIGASTDALTQFSEKTKLYSFGAKRFREIVDRVETRQITPNKIAKKILQILHSNSTRFAYSINRNPMLCLLTILPAKIQLYIIGRILRSK